MYFVTLEHITLYEVVNDFSRVWSTRSAFRKLRRNVYIGTTMVPMVGRNSPITKHLVENLVRIVLLNNSY